MAKNSQLILNQPIPLKIFYLKQEKLIKNIQTPQNQKPTLAYLSSIIQDQKKSLKKQQYQMKQQKQIKQLVNNSIKSNNGIMITTIHNNNSNIHKNNKDINNNKNNKQQSDNSKQQSLPDIVGQQWSQYQNLPKLTRQKLIRGYSYKPKSRVQSNQKAFKKDFETFLFDRSHSKLQRIQPKQQLAITFNHQKPLQQDNHSNYQSVRQVFERKRKIPSTSQKKRKLSMGNSVIVKMNFPHLDNFNWIKVHNNSNYTCPRFKI